MSIFRICGWMCCTCDEMSLKVADVSSALRGCRYWPGGRRLSLLAILAGASTALPQSVDDQAGTCAFCERQIPRVTHPREADQHHRPQHNPQFDAAREGTGRQLADFWWDLS